MNRVMVVAVAGVAAFGVGAVVSVPGLSKKLRAVLAGSQEPAAARPAVTPPPAAALGELLTARQGFRTDTRPVPDRPPAGPAAEPPSAVFERVRYPSPAGNLVAYLTPDPGDGKRRPAVLWAHTGADGIGEEAWQDAHPVAAFRRAGLVVMVPSWRGENDNPGRFELCYGEVDDLLAARDALARQPHVDPTRIYLVGHRLGGTLVLLAATTTDKFRAAFAFSGHPDLYPLTVTGKDVAAFVPFDPLRDGEIRLRSATHFVGGIRRPVFHFEGCPAGEGEGTYPFAEVMQTKAERLSVPFRTFALPWGDPFTVVPKAARLLAAKIKADDDPDAPFTLTKSELGAR